MILIKGFIKHTTKHVTLVVNVVQVDVALNESNVGTKPDLQRIAGLWKQDNAEKNDIIE